MKQRLWLFMTAGAWLVLDQLTKYLVQSRMRLGQTFAVIEDFFHLTYIFNPGASFGLLKDQKELFVLVTIGALGLLYWFHGSFRQRHGMSILAGLVAGGAIGNLIDRLRFGAVVDFIDFRGIWPYIFNVADMGIIVGGFLLVLSYYVMERKKEREHDSSST